jgi:dTDP-4-amino-4,6-dideoxygalactose transaminase
MTKNYNTITKFEQALAEFTGAPYVVATDCCTHAIELCFRLLDIKACSLPAHTYVSVPQTLRLLGVDYDLDFCMWLGEYRFKETPVWDSARMLRPGMYRAGQYQCLSFGPGKPLDNTRGGAVLLDHEEHYKKLKQMSNDGRDLSIARWQDQETFGQGYHYMMRIEEAESAMTKLQAYQARGQFAPEYRPYPDCRQLKFV